VNQHLIKQLERARVYQRASAILYTRATRYRTLGVNDTASILQEIAAGQARTARNALRYIVHLNKEYTHV
jgi:hypothetical protein